MEIGKIVFQRLFDSAEITQIVGDKIYPGKIAEDRVFPAIVYAAQSNPVPTKDVLNIDQPRVQVFIYSSSYEEAQRLSSLCQSALQSLDFYTMHGINVHYGALVSSQDDYEPELKIHQVQQDYNFTITW